MSLSLIHISDGWENVTGNLKESWNQLLAVIGKPILQVATNIVQKHAVLQYAARLFLLD